MTARMQYIMNGQAHGDMASMLLQHGLQPGVLRPYMEDDGVSYMTVNQGGQDRVVVANAAATLRKQEWEHIDREVLAIAKPRLKLVNWMRSKNMVYNLPNALGNPVFQSETRTDISPARISMDALAAGDNDRVEYNMVNLPIPVISKEFEFNARQIAASRNGPAGTGSASPLDTTTLEAAAVQVVEMAERFVAGTYGSYSFGGGTAYGMINSPQRVTMTFRDPAGGGWTPEMLFDDVAAMVAALVNLNHYGPYKLWHGTGLTATMMKRFNAYDGTPLGTKLAELPNISGVEQADYIPGKRLVLCEESKGTARLVFGMDVSTLQWQSKGGLLSSYIVMAIMVPQIRADAIGNTGIVDAVAA